MMKTTRQKLITTNWHLEPLTLQDLTDMKPETIFKSGLTSIVHPWYTPFGPHRLKTTMPDGRTLVKYVAVRGIINDWAIYHSLDANLEPSVNLDGITHLNASIRAIYQMGAKLYNREDIRQIVPCTDEAFMRYRY